MKLLLLVIGQGHEDHRELLLGDLALGLVAHSLQDGLLKVDEVLCVVVLGNRRRTRKEGERII